jgi:hypothetical protein
MTGRVAELCKSVSETNPYLDKPQRVVMDVNKYIQKL